MKRRRLIIAVLAAVAAISAGGHASCGRREPRTLYPYCEEEVTFANGKDGAKLAGALTIPDTEKAFPAVVLISGSGLQDRDETAYGHKPFEVLADFLSRRGIAVLRYDDRGAGLSIGPLEGVTPEHFAEDAYAGLRYLKARKDLNIGDIGLIGHSMGAVEGGILASRRDDVAFLVMLAGPGIPLDENMLKADSVSNSRSGRDAEAVRAGQILLRSLIARVKKDRDSGDTEADLDRIINEWRNSLPAGIKEGIDAFTESNPDHWRAMASEWSTPYFRYVLQFDPRPVISTISCPVLSLIGEKDVQTLPEENSLAIEHALESGRCEDYRVEIVPGVNHLFQRCETGAISEYSRLGEPFGAGVPAEIAEWILKHTQ